MEFYWYLFLGFLGGIPAGMGMGGGTVTIPLLTLAGGVTQKTAQAANLFAFAPMSAPALSMHAKNGLLKTKGLGWTIVPALIVSLAGALVASFLPSGLLRRGFGLFLTGLSLATFRSAMKTKNQGKNQGKKTG